MGVVESIRLMPVCMPHHNRPPLAQSLIKRRPPSRLYQINHYAGSDHFTTELLQPVLSDMLRGGEIENRKTSHAHGLQGRENHLLDLVVYVPCYIAGTLNDASFLYRATDV